MEDIFRKKQQAVCCVANRVSTTSPHHLNSMHKDSQSISKAAAGKPKIRIIHIFAPEIIKTDVANFRELVQRLTGKPPPPNHRHRQDLTSFCHKKKKSTRSSGNTASSASRRSSREEDEPEISAYNCDNNNKMEMRIGCKSSIVAAATRERDRIKKGEEDQDEEIWKSSAAAAGCDCISSCPAGPGGGGGFLNGFADMDGFMQELGGFPVLPNPMDASHHLHHPHVVFGESQFA